MDMNMTQDEAAIRRLIEDWASAVRAQKVDKIVDRHANDIVMFDVPPPVELRGICCVSGDMAAVFRVVERGGRHLRDHEAGGRGR